MIVGLLIVQTIVVSIIIRILLEVSWMSYILFIVFLSGILVVFVYVGSLACNSVLYRVGIQYIVIVVVVGLVAIMLIDIEYIYKIDSRGYCFNWRGDLRGNIVSRIYGNRNEVFSVLLAVYLLLGLVVSIKVSSKFKGAVRSIL